MKYALGGGRASWSRRADLRTNIRIALSKLGKDQTQRLPDKIDDLAMVWRDLYAEMKEKGIVK